MFQFDFSYTSYEQLINDLSQRLHTPIVNNRLVFPAAVARGDYVFVGLPNGIHVALVDITFNQDWLLHRRKSKNEFYTLRFHELMIPGELEIRIGKERMHESHTIKAVAYLTNTLADWSYLGSRGNTFKGIDILFNAEWLAAYLGITNLDDVLSAYLALELENVNSEPLDSEYKRLMQEVVEANVTEGPMRLAIVQNRIMLLIERFFLRLYARRKNAFFNVPLSKADINRMMQVEAALTRDIFEPAPTISQLAKMVSVSESKLKKDFKIVYGSPVYEYFQKTRMQIARDKLLAGDSVKAVAMQLGYSNLSNFTIAFKKEFGLLPSKLVH